MHQDATWYGVRPQPRGLCVRWGPSPFPFPKRRRSPPIFRPCLLWPSGWMDQDGTWHGGRPWSIPHCARSGHPHSQKGRSQTQFSDHLYCGKTAGCIKMPLGMEVGLSPGDFVLDGDPAPRLSQKGGGAPQSSAHVYCG